jgi:hypothetical protein
MIVKKTIGNFFQNMGGLKFSGLCRRMRREVLDASMPGPPSYFSRRREGIPILSWSLFIKGYKNLFAIYLDIQSKILENSYLLMNRTNEKGFLSTVDDMDAPGRSSCALCGGRENIMQLMFECEQYSEPLWKLLKNAVNETIIRINDNELPTSRVKMHAFLVLYSVW